MAVVVRIVMGLIAGITGTVFFGVAAVVIRLMMGPLSLDGYGDYLSPVLSRFAPDFDIKIEGAILEWPSIKAPLTVAARGIVATNRGGDKGARISGVSLSFSPLDLISGHLMPAHITLIQPDIYGVDLESLIIGAENPSGFQTDLKSLSVIRGRVRLGHWDFSDIQIDSHQTNNTQKIILSGAMDGRVFDMTLDHGIDTGTHFSLIMPTLLGTDFFHLNPRIQTFLKKHCDVFKYVHITPDSTLSMTAKGELGPDYRLISGDVSYGVKNIGLQIDTGSPIIITAAMGHLRGKSNKINDMSLILTLNNKTPLKITGTGVLTPETQTVSFHLDAQSGPISFDGLGFLWPMGIGGDVRTWILNHISGGTVPRATLTADGTCARTPHGVSFNLTALNGDIDVKDARVSYLDGLPPATHVNAAAHYTKQRFDIDILGAKSGDLRVSSGKLTIGDMTAGTTTLAMELAVGGPVSAALDFIGQKPLNLTQGFEPYLTGIRGNAQTQLGLSFPLTSALGFQDLKTTVRSVLSDLSYEVMVGNKKIPVTAKQLDFSFEKGRLDLSGQVFVNKIPFSGSWNYDRAQSKSQVSVQGALNPALFQGLGYDASPYIRGDFPVRCTYDWTSGILTCRVDGTSGTMWLLDFEKLPGIPAQAALTAYLGNGTGKNVTVDFKTGSQGIISFQGKWGKDGRFDEGTLNPFHLGDNYLTARYKRDGEGGNVTFSGGRLNMKTVLDHLDFGAQKSHWFNDSSFKLAGTVHTLILKDDRVFSGVTIDTTIAKGQIVQLKATASSGDDTKNPNIRAALESIPFDNQKRHFSLFAGDGGAFLQALGYGYQIHKGQLEISGTQIGTSKMWSGKARLRQFSLKKAPIFGRLLSLAFPTGLADLLSEKGLPFDSLRAQFDVSPGKLIIRKGRAVGSSLGVTVSGVVDRIQDSCHLYGSVIPARFLNTLVGKIPLIGQWITGGRHEGLVSISYEVKGPNKNPTIKTNPMSLLTPGFTRKLFDPDIDNSLLGDDDDDDSDGEFQKELTLDLKTPISMVN